MLDPDGEDRDGSLMGDSPRAGGGKAIAGSPAAQAQRRVSGQVVSPLSHKTSNISNYLASLISPSTLLRRQSVGVLTGENQDFLSAHQMYRTPVPDERPVNYLFRFPISVYGPYCEKLPKPSSGKVGAGPNQNVVNVVPLARRGMSNVALHKDLSVEAPSLADHASLLSLSRPFGQEWQKLCVMQPNNLTQLGTKLRLMATLAEEFAAFVAPIASRIVEERVLSLSQRSIKALPGFDHVFVHHGFIFVVACCPGRLMLYGSREAAHRAAANELKAARALAGAPLIDLVVPLSALITHMGSDVYVTAPVPLPGNAKDSLAYGTLNGKSIETDPCATFEAFSMAEYLSLARHQAQLNPPGNGGAGAEEGLKGFSVSQPAQLYTCAEVKQFFCEEEGCTFAMDLGRWLPAAVAPVEYSKLRGKDDNSAHSRRSRHRIEDTPGAHLSVLFRPEFLRHHCPVSLNGNAGSPLVPPSAQEKTGHATDHLFGVVIPQIVQELFAAQRQKPLHCRDISRIFHSQGLNLRYLGRVISDIEADLGVPQERYGRDDKGKIEETKEAILKILRLEVVARSWKSILYDSFAKEDVRALDDALAKDIVNHLRWLLKTNGDGANYWEDVLKPRMLEKFDYFVCPVVTDIHGALPSEGRRAQTDPNALQLYRAIRNTKVRIEKIVPTETWEEDEEHPGHVKLVGRGSHGGSGELEPAAASLTPLLGDAARVNGPLVARALEVISVEANSDVRGRRIVMQFKAKVRPLTPMILSGAVQAAVNFAASSMHEALSINRDSLELCQAVEEAAVKELSQIRRHSDTDPRSTLPLTLQTHALIGKGQTQEAFTVLTKWLDLRCNSQPDLIAAKSAMEGAVLFTKMGRADRAESLLVDALHFLKLAGQDTINRLAGQIIFTSARLMSSVLWNEGRIPSADRVVRLLEYFHLAAGIYEKLRDRSLPYVIEAIASFRKQLCQVVRCFHCRGTPEFICHQCEHEHPERLIGTSNVPTERDALSSHQGNRQHNLNSTMGSLGGPKGKLKRGGKREEAKARQEEDITELFVKATLGPVENLLFTGAAKKSAGADQGSDSQILNAEAVVPPAAAKPNPGVTIDAPLMAEEWVTDRVVAQEGQYLGGSLLDGLAIPADLTRASRYFCSSCKGNHEGHEGTEPLYLDTAKTYSRALKLLHVGGPLNRSVTDPALGTSLLALGTIQNEPAIVGAAIADYAQVYGDSSRQVIGAELQLAEVLKRRSEVVNPYTGPTRDPDYLVQAQDTLHQILGKLLAKQDLLSRFYQELTSCVQMLHDVIELFSQLACAKREHQGRHYLIDVLSPVLGPTHPLVATALGKIFAYYLNLSRNHPETTLAHATALTTAGRYAVQWLDCHLAMEDSSTMVDSTLTEFREKVVKVLRGGGPNERQAATDLAAKAKSAIVNSKYNNHPIVVAALKALDDVFRKQLKVVEQSEKSAKIVQDLHGMATELRSILRRVSQHADRTDRYCQMLVRRGLEIRSIAVDYETKSRDPNIAEAAQDLKRLHDELLKFSESTPSNDDGSGTGGAEGGAPTGKGGNSASSATIAKGLSEFDPSAILQKNNLEDPLSDTLVSQGSEFDKPSVLRGPYVSPYNVLPPPPATFAESFGAGMRPRTQSRSHGSLSHQAARRPTSRMSTTILSPGKSTPSWLTQGQGNGYGSGPSISVPDAEEKKLETTQQLRRLFPKLSSTTAKKDYSKLKNIL
jgi:hypothetical protein